MGAYNAELGTLLIGIIFNTYLFGIVTHQYSDYYNTKFNDPLRIRVSVLTLFTIDIIHTVLVVYLAWVYFVENIEILSEPQWACGFIPLGTAITASITHIFLGFRILSMSKKQVLFVLILALTLAEFGAALALSVRMWTMKSMSELFLMKPFIIPWLITQTTLDLFVSGFLSLFLHRHRTGHVSTDGVINRLIRGAIQTGAFSAILAVTGLVVFLVRPHTILYAVFMIPIGRTYTTTLMDTLNVRIQLKERLLNIDDNNFNDRTWGNPNDPFALSGARLVSRQPASPYLPVFPKTQTESLIDGIAGSRNIVKPQTNTETPLTASISLPKPEPSKPHE